MAIWHNAPHTCTTYSMVSGTDAGGGVSLTPAVVQSSVKCLVNTASASEQERFAQQNQVVTHTVSFLSSVLTTPLTRGMKLVTSTGVTLHVRGISVGQAFRSIPSFVYAYCESLN